MHSDQPLFSPETSSASEYVMVVLTLLNNFQKTLRERQSQCLNKVRWGQPVIPGKHASFTIDRKHRGIRNPYDTDPNAVSSNDEAEMEDGPPQTGEGVIRVNEESNVAIQSELCDNEQSENPDPAFEQQTKVPILMNEPLKMVPSDSGDSLHSNQDDDSKLITKKQKLCRKLRSNKENHKQVHCLQRRSLFRKARQDVAVASVLPTVTENPDSKTNQIHESLPNNIPNGMTTSLETEKLHESNGIISLERVSFDNPLQDFSVVLPTKHENHDQGSSPKCKSLSSVLTNNLGANESEELEEEENPVPYDSAASEEFPFMGDKLSSPSSSVYDNEKYSPLRESNPSGKSCEIRSCSPVFSAYESPFRNSASVSVLKENSTTSNGELAAGYVGYSVTNSELMNDVPDLKLHSILSESEDDDFIQTLQRKPRKLDKLVITRKLQNQLKDNSMKKSVETPTWNIQTHNKPHSRSSESEDIVEALSREIKKSKKLQKQKLMVQCPLCCEWFKPKVIETHAANCGINTPIQSDEQENTLTSISVSNENSEVQKETSNLNCSSMNEDPKADPITNPDPRFEDESVKTVALIQNVEYHPISKSSNNSEESTRRLSTSLDDSIFEPVAEKCLIGLGNSKTTETHCVPPENPVVPPEIVAKALDSIPMMKRCYICDTSYVDGKPFSNHLRSCRKQYQKLKRQFSAISDENEEPQRKTRSRSSPASRINGGDS